MLASTVQFSRYGRTQPRDRCSADIAGRSTQDWPDEETVARSLRTQQRTYGHPSCTALVPACARANTSHSLYWT